MDASATILAVATPPAPSLRGLIRISGERAFDVLRTHIAVRKQCRATAVARLRCDQFDIATIVAAYPAPASYTGEDTVELQLPGNVEFLVHVIDVLIDSAMSRNIDARRAEPGEFTARAFFNGKLSLLEAEAVAATIAAQSDAQLHAARQLAGGVLGRLTRRLADDLAHMLALVEAGIDFTDEEDVVAVSPVELKARLRELESRIDRLLVRSTGNEQLLALPRVVLAGPPNAGKSTLFNALLGRDRVVTSAMPGTTRDAIVEPLRLQGDYETEVLLVDIAGVDSRDSLINVHMQRSAREELERADVIVKCTPATDSEKLRSKQSERSEFDAKAVLHVVTKCDLLDDKGNDQNENNVCVSALKSTGLTDLRVAIGASLPHSYCTLAGESLALGARHEAALRTCGENLKQAISHIEEDDTVSALQAPELIAASMRCALDQLALLAGDIAPDDILGRIFSTFCIGK